MIPDESLPKIRPRTIGIMTTGNGMSGVREKVRTRNTPNPTDKKAALADYTGLLGSLGELLEIARRASARAVNAFMTATYWEVGRRIVEFEQEGEERAEYGESLLLRLADDLTARFGKGFGKSNLFLMRKFYLASAPIFQTPSGKLNDRLGDTQIFQTESGIFDNQSCSILSNKRDEQNHFADGVCGFVRRNPFNAAHALRPCPRHSMAKR